MTNPAPGRGKPHLAAVDSSVELSSGMLSGLFPMHLLIGESARIESAGPTMRKMLPEGAVDLFEAFVLTRPSVQDDDYNALVLAAQGGERVFLRMIEPPNLTLRGCAVETGDGRLLLNLGFGISLADAVRELELKDSDFAPSELAIELLFLHEANRAVMSELSRFNLRLEEAREVAETQAFSDPLTGLYNRRGLELALKMALRSVGAGERGGRAAGPADSFALAHLDLDRFKEVNDRHGHAAGDEVLCRVAQILRGETRNNDTVARVGGDEFVLILPGMVSAPALQRLSDRIIAEIERPTRLGEADCLISASIGVTTSSQYDAPSAETMLADADAALYASKNAGRGRATIHGQDSQP